MTDPGPEHIGAVPLAGYLMRDYDGLIAALGESREIQGLSLRQLGTKAGHADVPVGKWLNGKQWALGPNLFDLAHALGYGLALIPRKDTP